jgi:hypothetical protein
MAHYDEEDFVDHSNRCLHFKKGISKLIFCGNRAPKNEAYCAAHINQDRDGLFSTNPKRSVVLNDVREFMLVMFRLGKKMRNLDIAEEKIRTFIPKNGYFTRNLDIVRDNRRTVEHLQGIPFDHQRVKDLYVGLRNRLVRTDEEENIYKAIKKYHDHMLMFANRNRRLRTHSHGIIPENENPVTPSQHPSYDPTYHSPYRSGTHDYPEFPAYYQASLSTAVPENTIQCINYQVQQVTCDQPPQRYPPQHSYDYLPGYPQYTTPTNQPIPQDYSQYDSQHNTQHSTQCPVPLASSREHRWHTHIPHRDIFSTYATDSMHRYHDDNYISDVIDSYALRPTQQPARYTHESDEYVNPSHRHFVDFIPPDPKNWGLKNRRHRRHRRKYDN